MREGLSPFSVDFFCLTVPRIFVEEHLCVFRKFPVSKNFTHKKVK